MRILSAAHDMPNKKAPRRSNRDEQIFRCARSYPKTGRPLFGIMRCSVLYCAAHADDIGGDLVLAARLEVCNPSQRLLDEVEMTDKLPYEDVSAGFHHRIVTAWNGA